MSSFEVADYVSDFEVVREMGHWNRSERVKLEDSTVVRISISREQCLAAREVRIIQTDLYVNSVVFENCTCLRRVLIVDRADNVLTFLECWCGRVRVGRSES